MILFITTDNNQYSIHCINEDFTWNWFLAYSKDTGQGVRWYESLNTLDLKNTRMADMSTPGLRADYPTIFKWSGIRDNSYVIVEVPELTNTCIADHYPELLL